MLDTYSFVMKCEGYDNVIDILFYFQLERFMPQEGAFVATLYAPIMFPPAPALVFTQDKHTSK